MKVKRRPIASVDAALRAYYGNGYLSNKEIKEIFQTSSDASVQRLKKPVIEAEKKEDHPVVVPFHVNTRIAFKVWGIDVKELEKNRKKRQGLDL